MARFRISWRLIGEGFVGFVFAGAGLLKFVDGPGRLQLATAQLGLFPDGWAIWIAYCIPAVEILLGLWIATGLEFRTALLTALFMLSGFTVGLVRLGFVTGWKADCGCLGPIDGGTIAFGIVRNLVIAALCLLLAITPRSRILTVTDPR